MIEYHVNRLAYSKRAITLAFISCIIIFVFVWQGVESMTKAIDDRNTLLRILILITMFTMAGAFSIYFWLYSNYQKMRAATEYAKTASESAEERIRREFDEKYLNQMGEISQMIETLEWQKAQYEKLISKVVSNRKQEISIPIDYSMDRNRIVFIQQKGANGQTVYEYAYYEVLNDKLIVGKANFKRKLYSTQDKRDSLNRMIGVEDAYTTDIITVYKQLELNVNDIPQPYRTAIQLGALKTETVLSLSKQWVKQSPEPPPLKLQEVEGGEDTIQLDIT